MKGQLDTQTERLAASGRTRWPSHWLLRSRSIDRSPTRDDQDGRREVRRLVATSADYFGCVSKQ